MIPLKNAYNETAANGRGLLLREEKECKNGCFAGS